MLKIDHIGYLSNDINASINAFKQIGYTQVTEVILDDMPGKSSPPRHVYLCFLEGNGIRVELVSPMNENSDVYNILKRQGEGPYHICYQVENLEKQIAEMGGAWLVLKKPEEAIAFNKAKVAFLFKKGIGLVELLETVNEGVSG